ncbi:MAG: hypothetical protein RLN60_03825 [Phycisphaerales bacterium]
MLAPVRRLANRLHEDESAPNTVEWVLLIIIGLILLVAIFLFAQFVIQQFQQREQAVQNDPFLQN